MASTGDVKTDVLVQFSHVSWYSEVQRDDLKVPFGLNFIHPLFIITAPSHSNKGWMLKIGFSKHLSSLQSNTPKKCSRVAGYIPSENAIFLLVTHQRIATLAVCFLLNLFSCFHELSKQTCSHFFWRFTICDTCFIIFQNIFAPCVKAILSQGKRLYSARYKQSSRYSARYKQIKASHILGSI